LVHSCVVIVCGDGADALQSDAFAPSPVAKAIAVPGLTAAFFASERLQACKHYKHPRKKFQFDGSVRGVRHAAAGASRGFRRWHAFCNRVP
jgi:hypothetical protein